MEQKKGSVERFFGAHAQGYTKSQSHAHGADLDVLIEALKPKVTDAALDVATGTGFTAVALARLARHVTGIDVTKEMLEEARRLANTEGLGNVEFEKGDALDIRYCDGSFDIVTTRRATHHFQDVPGFLREARRVLKPGGRLGVVDMSPPEGTEAFCNKIEKLRDSSHMEAFPPSAWKSMVSGAGFQIGFARVLEEPVTLEKWLYPVETGGREEKEIRQAWTMASPQVMKLLCADVKEDAIRGWTKARLILVGSKA